jgi:hypothetical protein
LNLLLKLDMRIVVLDAIYDEVTSDPVNYPKDFAVKELIDHNQPPFVIESTDKGKAERAKSLRGEKRSKNAGEVAIADFMSAENGLRKYLSALDPVAVLFEDADIPGVRFFRKPPNLHLFSTVGMLRGLERIGFISSAEEIIQEMTHPSNPEKRNSARKFTDLPGGIDDPAAIGSTWVPQKGGAADGTGGGATGGPPRYGPDTFQH